MTTELCRKLQDLGASSQAMVRLQALVKPGPALPPASVVVPEGEALNHLHVLTEGWAVRFRSLPDGQRQTTALVLAGEVCDLDALALGRCDGHVATLTAARTALLPLSQLQELLLIEPTLAAAFFRLHVRRELVATEWMVSLGRRSAFERIAHLLCETAVRLGASTETGEVRFPLPMTQSELADASGLSIVHVNRSLQALRRQTGLVVERKGVTIPDWKALTRLAGFDPAYLAPTPQAQRAPAFATG